MKRVFIRGEEGKFVNYIAALTACGVEAVMSMDLSRAADCDGLLLPGGADMDPALYGQVNTASEGIDPNRDRDELKLVEMFMKAEKPILGICRGHQVLNVAFGGTLIQDLADEKHRRHQQTDTDRIHPLTVVHPFMKALYGERFMSNSSHHQAVDELGQGLEVTCRSEKGVVEGFIHKNGRVIGVQFHPERMAFGLRRPDADDGEAVFRAFTALL